MTKIRLYNSIPKNFQRYLLTGDRVNALRISVVRFFSSVTGSLSGRTSNFVQITGFLVQNTKHIE